MRKSKCLQNVVDLIKNVALLVVLLYGVLLLVGLRPSDEASKLFELYLNNLKLLCL